MSIRSGLLLVREGRPGARAQLYTLREPRAGVGYEFAPSRRPMPSRSVARGHHRRDEASNVHLVAVVVSPGTEIANRTAPTLRQLPGPEAASPNEICGSVFWWATSRGVCQRVIVPLSGMVSLQPANRRRHRQRHTVSRQGLRQPGHRSDRPSVASADLGARPEHTAVANGVHPNLAILVHEDTVDQPKVKL